VTINVNSEIPYFVQTNADKDGVYLLNFDTVKLAKGQHSTRSKSVLNGEVSSYSNSLDFIVGNNNVFAKTPSKCSTKADLNSDCKVNIVDFSIAAY
jgi:hypothetical protein